MEEKAKKEVQKKTEKKKDGKGKRTNIGVTIILLLISVFIAFVAVWAVT